MNRIEKIKKIETDNNLNVEKPQGYIFKSFWVFILSILFILSNQKEKTNVTN